MEDKVWIPAPTFNLKDKVRHTTNNECPLGVVIDISYNLRGRCYKYCVSFGIYPDQETWLYEEELTTENIVI